MIMAEHGVLRPDRSPSPAPVIRGGVDPMAAIVAVLALWFVSCAVFNDLTPRMIVALNGASCEARPDHTFCPSNKELRAELSETDKISCGETCGAKENSCMPAAGECFSDGTVGVTMIELSITIVRCASVAIPVVPR